MYEDQINQSSSFYSFGETDLAAERLQVVSEIFDPTSEVFISEAVRSRPHLALDLGCGPGFTTQLLSRIARAEKTVGVDRSEAFLNRARANSTDASEEFVAADVAAVPMSIEGLPGRPDLIYARFLASHLPEPERAIVNWTRELEVGGLLLIEELESVSTKVVVFEEYLEILSEMLSSHGNELLVGARLATVPWDELGLGVEINRTVEVWPSTGQAAKMFYMNLLNWRQDPYVRTTYPHELIEWLAAELDELISTTEMGLIVCQMRQSALCHHSTEVASEHP